ncbi:hypothetical protein ERJ75_001238000 [Trypanosoma vivax]|uniref:Calponin-homology (CH) domain-containing protein n=1 Tax=Trypanosoma vivax (strain Y486) TaxID=1055687 RepID=G0U0N4_TRYVY|nr:hypothetical protein ERJ75_001238000 [Trypanosoma vivax]CCC49633.1 conserved hypothetical protein [Trypanosoma vivax Y486]
MNSTSNNLLGRTALLQWVNNVCSTQYPSIESLRDGVAYCTIIEAVLCRVTDNCVLLSSSEAEDFNLRAQHASYLLSRLQWEVTLLTCRNAAPSSDSIQEHSICRKNFNILQFMIRDCLPPGFFIEINVARLSSGMLQDHLRLLRWIHDFVRRMLDKYSKLAIRRRLRDEHSLGSVEGVRMTRALMLHRKMVRDKYIALGSKSTVANKSGSKEVAGSSTCSRLTSIRRGNTNMTLKDSFLSPSNAVKSLEVEISPGYCGGVDLTNFDKEKKIIGSQKLNSLYKSIELHAIQSHAQKISFRTSYEYTEVVNEIIKEIQSFEVFVGIVCDCLKQSFVTRRHFVDVSTSYLQFSSTDLIATEAPHISIKNARFLKKRDTLRQTIKLIQDVVNCFESLLNSESEVAREIPLLAGLVECLNQM